jgi:hypothetical protein
MIRTTAAKATGRLKLIATRLTATVISDCLLVSCYRRFSPDAMTGAKASKPLRKYSLNLSYWRHAQTFAPSHLSQQFRPDPALFHLEREVVQSSPALDLQRHGVARFELRHR